MRKLALLTAVVAAAALAFAGGAFLQANQDEEHRPLVHVVLFQFGDDVGEESVAQFIQDVHALSEIPTVQNLSVGRRMPSDRDVAIQDYDVALSMCFDSPEDLQAYIEHPMHVEFATSHRPMIAQVRVADFFCE